MKTRSARKKDTRRQEARRQRSQHRMQFWQVIMRAINPYSLLIWMGFFVACVAIMLAGAESMQWELGQRIDRNITSRIDFEVEDLEATERNREAARESAPNVYVKNNAPSKRISAELTHLLELAKLDAKQFAAQAKAQGWKFKDSEAIYQVLQQYVADAQGAQAWDDMVRQLVNRLGAEYLVRKTTDNLVRARTPRTSILRQKGQPDNTVLTTQLQLVTDSGVVQEAAKRVVQHESVPPSLRAPLADLITQTLIQKKNEEIVYQPLWEYDREATAAAMDQEGENVAVIVYKYKRGDPLVRADTTAKLDGPEIALLKQEHQKYLEKQETDPQLARAKLLRQLGMATVVLLLTLGVMIYCAYYQSRVLEKPARSLGLAGLTLLIVGLGRLVDYPANWAPEFSVGLVVMGAALLTIAYNQRFAFGISGALSLLVALSCRGDLGLFLTNMTAASITVFALREVRTRSKIIAVGAMASLGAFIVALASGLINGEELSYVLKHAIAAALSTLGAGFVVQGILPTFEKVFGVATSMTLLEWCDASRALLRRLAQEAPGTYTHSSILAQLSEEAAEAIGARGLLARVGALYHDVGKIQKPAYFAENQQARINRHERLSPTISHLIIVGHVKDGLELARAYGLPRIIHPFILEHHGTTVVKYFHQMASGASKNSKTKGKHNNLTEHEFRYPGPKPSMKETAILMLADICESAIRARDEITPGKIESTVHQLVMSRLNDGQFDNCEITMRELKIVEQSLVKSLGAIHHNRIKYPQAEEQKSPAA